ncbi:TMV resistance protein N [Spatholobus suberectus]|nr:TMV resistance protein N [Spatholobus suberectus]
MPAFTRLVVPLKYDVFLGFRGLDTRYTFTGTLYNALVNRGFRTFMDKPEMDKGTRITVEISKAIEVSRIFIIVLSENFASSSFCLEEVVEILKFPKGKGRWVLPVFYCVDPSDLIATYEQALTDLKEWYEDEKIEEWRTALSKLAKFPGCRLKRDNNIFECQHIEDILKEVSRHVPCQIGLLDRTNKVQELLCSGLDRGHMIGICGEAGTGKTMVAHEVFNSNAGRGFDHAFSFDDVGEILSNSGHVREEMSTLIRKKLFIIFEDIKHSEQLDNIVELTKQLGSGSIVIIISQDKCLLERCGIRSIYEVERFSETEANQLLVLKAFNSPTVSPKYVKILKRIEAYARGHPRILELIGSNLSGKSIEECEFALEKYESITNRDIQQIEEESFNALEKCQQEMLIHIASFDREFLLVDVEAKLHNKYKVCPRIDIRVLLDKSLIKINQHGQVTLHNSTRDMIKDKVSCFKAMKHGHGQRKSNEIKYEQHDVQYKEDSLELGPSQTKNPMCAMMLGMARGVRRWICCDGSGDLFLFGQWRVIPVPATSDAFHFYSKEPRSMESNKSNMSQMMEAGLGIQWNWNVNYHINISFPPLYRMLYDVFQAMKHGHGQRKSNEIKYEQHDVQCKEDSLELGPFQTKNPVSE